MTTATAFVVPNRPYRLVKRFRHDEEYNFLPKKKHWTKTIIDKRAGTILGRTPRKWLLLLIFYVIFFTSLAMLCTICWLFSTLTRSDVVPLVIHPQPGLCFEPTIDEDVMLPRIEYAADEEDLIDVYVQKIEELLDKYGPERGDRFQSCTSAEVYGYKSMEPCIFLKANRMIGFHTEPYTDSRDLPAEAPKDLKDMIAALPDAERKDRVWVSCTTGVTPQPTLTYAPTHRSVPTALLDVDQRYLYNGKDYRAKDFERIVAVKIAGVPKDTVVPFKCHLWAKNIRQDPTRRGFGLGVIKFELLIHSIHPNRKKPQA